LLPLLWLLAVKKKKLLQLLLQLLLQHLLQPLQWSKLPLLLLPALLQPLPAQHLLPAPLLTLPKALQPLPKTPLALLAMPPKKLLTQPKTQSRSNSSHLLKSRREAAFLRLYFYRRIHSQPSVGVAMAISVKRSSTRARLALASSGRLFCWLRCAATTTCRSGCLHLAAMSAAAAFER
jgi:hypothetical protein